MLQAYGFPPMPYPVPPGIDPAVHMQLLKTDPAYKASLEKEREKAFKEQMEREIRDKERKDEKSQSSSAIEDLRKLQQLQQQQQATLSVRPDLKMELKSEPKQEKVEAKDEGAKPTMETRGPPPATANPFGWPSGLMRPGMPGLPYDPLMASAMNPLLLATSQANPFGAAVPAQYLAQLQRMPGFNAAAAAELMRQAGPFGLGPPPTSGVGNTPVSLPEDLSRQAKALDLLQQHAMQLTNNHKIHELQERALKSPQGSSREKAATPRSSARPTGRR